MKHAVVIRPMARVVSNRARRFGWVPRPYDVGVLYSVRSMGKEGLRVESRAGVAAGQLYRSRRLADMGPGGGMYTGLGGRAQLGSGGWPLRRAMF